VWWVDEVGFVVVFWWWARRIAVRLTKSVSENRAANICHVVASVKWRRSSISKYVMYLSMAMVAS